MPSAITKFSDAPLRFVDEVFERLVIHEGKRTDDVLKHVLGVCKDEIATGGLLRQIPLLTEHNLEGMKNGSLVRYRCMIQDMREPEYFQSLYSTMDGSRPDMGQLHCSIWRETLEILDGHDFCEDGPRNETSERHVFVGSSIPAETPWARQYHFPGAATAAEAKTPDDGGSRLPVRQCMLKVYVGGDQVKLNEVLEFIGVFYSREHVFQQSDDDDILVGAVGNLSVSPQSNKPKPLPCIHVFHFERLVHYHPELSLPNGACEERQGRGQLLQMLNGNIPEFRARLVNAFTEYLFKGDELVSEYFLCHLMSSVYAKEAGVSIGHFSLNVIINRMENIDPNWAETRVRPFLEQVLTQVSYLPLSLSTLNSGSLVSKKCYETDRLISGPLQLPKGTELIIDETKLQPGQLDNQGVKNMAALRGMIKWQKVDYDFGFNTCEFSTDIRTLIVSEGPSILSSDFAIPLRSSQSSGTAPNADATPIPILENKEFVDAARVYFALAPTLAFTIDDSMQTQIQEDFVALRRDGNTGVTADYLHRLLTVARMMSLSSGDSRLRQEIWNKAKTMEAVRLERMKK